ncbi:Na+/H+ antiporter NhaC family protein [Roseibacillus ishigakijimensis]|uniref:Na+/H+ antiporter NhaC-like C-terminal domain-containing protein n=1 Tax=Roseibacillus ishigakijimensis TaxID=454146 RepID=A0A934RT93_9BACT|nr:Na+/H+ antiporter NhaC family protein [Roseibacillus ishigakijimensis]MBK1833775.1 hypothetical protein [Roseibacillus ishigakijimensis]
MSSPRRSHLLGWFVAGACGVVLLVSPQASPLIPPLAALALLALTRSAGWSLLAGSLLGVALLTPGPLWTVPGVWLREHLGPALTSSWHWSALLFTLLLAAFAAVVDRSGALAALLQRLTRTAPSGGAGQRFQLAIVSLGLICFFDGLANALMLGRVGRSLADRCGVTREKLAYLVDTTSSAVACVAFLSTWSVFQLTLISQELADSPFSEPAYLLFLKSIPTNFYCLGSLLLVVLAARWNWCPPPMKGSRARRPPQTAEATLPLDKDGWLPTVGPLAILLFSVPLAFWIVGGEGSLPSSLASIQQAFATSRGPYALILAGALALAGALLCFPKKRWGEGLRAIPEGVRSILPALLVLVLAWTLGSTLSALGTGAYLAGLLGENFPLSYLPGATFLLSCLIAFATGTSWGTMALMMPLALGTFLTMHDESALEVASAAPLLPAIIGAVFGGAVFGDHASPFSDTTIVSALACDITTTAHVATQLPYAGLAAAMALLLGYLPLAWGLPPGLTAVLPLAGIALVVLFTRKKFSLNEE